MKIGAAISLSLLGHGIVLMSWPGTTDINVNSTPSSFQVTLQQKQAIKMPTTHQEIKSFKTIKKVQVENTERKQKEVYKEAQIEQTNTSDIRLNPETRAHVVKRITAAMENYFQYPMLAKRNGWQGKVTLALLLDADGSFENVHIKAGSGFKILDQSALDALLKVRKINKTEHWFNMRDQEIVIPVIYHLKEG